MISSAFTGHRSCNNLAGIEQLIDCAGFYQITHFYVGMAMGADLIFAQKLVQRKLQWTAVIPFPGHDEMWPTDYKDELENLLVGANGIRPNQIVIDSEFSHQSYWRRNRYMVEKSQFLLAYWDGKQSGTGTWLCVKEAQKFHLPIIQFNPLNNQLTLPPVQLSLPTVI